MKLQKQNAKLQDKLRALEQTQGMASPQKQLGQGQSTPPPKSIIEGLRQKPQEETVVISSESPEDEKQKRRRSGFLRVKSGFLGGRDKRTPEKPKATKTGVSTPTKTSQPGDVLISPDRPEEEPRSGGRLGGLVRRLSTNVLSRFQNPQARGRQPESPHSSPQSKAAQRGPTTPTRTHRKPAGVASSSPDTMDVESIEGRPQPTASISRPPAHAKPVSRKETLKDKSELKRKGSTSGESTDSKRIRTGLDDPAAIYGSRESSLQSLASASQVPKATSQDPFTSTPQLRQPPIHNPSPRPGSVVSLPRSHGHMNLAAAFRQAESEEAGGQSVSPVLQQPSRQQPSDRPQTLTYRQSVLSFGGNTGTTSRVPPEDKDEDKKSGRSVRGGRSKKR